MQYLPGIIVRVEQVSAYKNADALRPVLLLTRSRASDEK